MIRFSKYTQIDERKRVDSETRSWLRKQTKPYSFWLNDDWKAPLPISGPMMKRLGLAENRKAVHITTIQGLQSLLSNQNSARSVSVMTLVDSAHAEKLMKGGIATKGGVAVELQGDIAITAPFDIWSKPDTQGRRWFDIDKLANVMRQKPFTEWVEGYQKALQAGLKEVTGAISNKFADDLRALMYDMSDDFLVIKKFPELAKPWWVHVKKWIDHAEEYQKANNRKEPPGVEKEYKRVVKTVNSSLNKITKRLFDIAEEYLKEGLPLIQNALLQEKYKNVKYSEGIMQNFTAKEIWYDVDDIGEQVADQRSAIDLGLDVDDEGIVEGIDPDDPDAFFKYSELAERVIRKILKDSGSKAKIVRDEWTHVLFDRYQLDTYIDARGY